MITENGGKDTPAIGFAMGIERLLLAMGDQETESRLDAFIVTTKPEYRPHALQLARMLREAGLAIEVDLRGNSLKSQFRRADKSGARYALTLGEDEVAKQSVQVKNLKEGTQEELGCQEVIARLITQRRR